MKKKILFLDDDKYEMLGLLERLESEEYEVVFCVNSKEAKEVLRRGFKPDLIISDLIIRNKVYDPIEEKYHSGVNFCGFIREEVHLNCPIIILTVVTQQSIIESVKKYNALLLNKPITPRQLLARVKEKINQGTKKECVKC